jgi:polyisoprenoid-binding protein YceI
VGIYAVYVFFIRGESEVSVDIADKEKDLCIEQDQIDIEGVYLFQIVSTESEVRFQIDEELQGRPTRVVGKTDQVGGYIVVNRNDPSASQVCEITINVRDLETDQRQRNIAIQQGILKSAEDQYEFAYFTPTTLDGMPETITLEQIGESFSFQVTGDFQLVDTTRSVTFEMEVTPLSETQITGYGTTTIRREDYGLEIPTVPGVANVSQEVQLEIEFVAELVESAETP